ncbi:hypothetical protein GGP97_002751 [Salinibacter ruber]|nr:hypothetical protein [Salinibacter ruber]MCS4174814.1 hypothetical protein [Salinibacter ruber]
MLLPGNWDDRRAVRAFALSTGGDVLLGDQGCSGDLSRAYFFLRQGSGSVLLSRFLFSDPAQLQRASAVLLGVGPGLLPQGARARVPQQRRPPLLSDGKTFERVRHAPCSFYIAAASTDAGRV